MARNKTVGYSPATSAVHSRWRAGGIGMVLIIVVIGAGFLLGRATVPHARAPVPEATGLLMRDGVPVPDRHSVAGAATTAQNFQIAGFGISAGTLDSAVAAKVLLASDADASTRQALIAPTSDTGQLAKTRTSFAPVSTVVISYTPAEAVIQVWGVATTSSQVTPQPGGTETWGRTTITVVWDGSQWRVRQQQYSPGPWPVRADQRLADSAGDFAFRFNELRQLGWSYVPEP